MIRIHFYFLSSRSIAACLLLCALSCSTIHHMHVKRKIEPEGCSSASYSPNSNHNLVECVVCLNDVDKDYCLLSCPTPFDTIGKHLCCLNCVTKVNGASFSHRSNSLSYSCPFCRAEVSISIDGHPIASILDKFMSACRDLDLYELSNWIPKDASEYNYAIGLSKLSKKEGFYPLHKVLYNMKAQETILNDNAIKIILMLLILKEKSADNISRCSEYLLDIINSIDPKICATYWEGYLRPALSFFLENELACKKNKTPKTIDIHELLDYALAHQYKQIVEICMGTSMLKQLSIMDVYHRNESLHSTYTPLHFAAFLGDLDKVTALLQDPKIDVNQVTNDDHKHTALHLAINKGHDKIVNLLLSHSTIDVNFYNGNQDTPLHLAVQQCRRSEGLEIVRALLNKKGINPNLKDKSGLAPIRLALPFGITLIKTFFTSDPCNGLDHNITDNDGNTLLHSAVRFHHDDLVTWMFESGYMEQFYVANKFENTPLTLSIELYKVYKQYTDSIDSDSDSDSTMDSAMDSDSDSITVEEDWKNKRNAMAEIIRVFKSFLEKGVRKEYYDCDVDDFIDKCYEQHAEILSLDNKEAIALHKLKKIALAFREKMLSCLNDLANGQLNQAQLNTRFKEDFLAFFSPPRDLTKSCFTTIRSSSLGETARKQLFHLAATEPETYAAINMYEYMKALVNSRDFVNNQGEDIMEQLLQPFLRNFPDLLLTVDYLGDSPLFNAIKNGSKNGGKIALIFLEVLEKSDKIKEVLEHKCNGNTMLMIASDCNIPVLKKLLNLDPEVAIKNNFGDTVLHHCVRNNNLGVLKLILDHVFLHGGRDKIKALVDQTNLDNKTPLSLAQEKINDPAYLNVIYDYLIWEL